MGSCVCKNVNSSDELHEMVFAGPASTPGNDESMTKSCPNSGSRAGTPATKGSSPRDTFASQSSTPHVGLIKHRHIKIKLNAPVPVLVFDYYDYSVVNLRTKEKTRFESSLRDHIRGLQEASAIFLGRTLYIMGCGETSQNGPIMCARPVPGNYAFSLSTLKLAELPTPHYVRYGPLLVNVSEIAIYVIGGEGFFASETACEKFVVRSKEWKDLPRFDRQRGRCYSACGFQGKVYVFRAETGDSTSRTYYHVMDSRDEEAGWETVQLMTVQTFRELRATFVGQERLLLIFYTNADTLETRHLFRGITTQLSLTRPQWESHAGLTEPTVCAGKVRIMTRDIWQSSQVFSYGLAERAWEGRDLVTSRSGQHIVLRGRKAATVVIIP